ncbi:hypothetical protein B0T26DRAFT_673131 [Lasiosphaeria miniovina]|uniref:Calpain catalytic domain-containing protein n=1 Tax=Lasiosphaeria miniovina TaxID=1954250 RepID=A0AA40E6B6_9PEZI|nr:uncharacterized protein B0T26DRAFT_673131 [Lasiosphaeria miniovina]KAK0728630.1 hypothetical protein B0T26DRAFT_673131 [Lasiosphaeria miniovina]
MSPSGSIIADGRRGRTVMAEMPVRVQRSHKSRQRSPQGKVDEFWRKFTTTAPGKATTLLPKNEYAERLARRNASKEVGGGTAAQASFEEAAALCRAKVEKIVAECRRVNQKYRDPHFDLEFDLKTGRRECLESLNNIKDESSDSDESSYPPPPRPRGSPYRQRKTRGATQRASRPDARRRPTELLADGVGGAPHASNDLHNNGNDEPPLSPQGRIPGSKFSPKSVKRVGEIFDDPKFYIDGPTANDVRQGRDGDCWLMAALCTLSNKAGLIERICVAHNQDVGVYGFVFHRDGEWFSEIIDDKLYLTKPDYDEAMAEGINIERLLWEDRERPDSEEIYRKTYQSNSGALYFAQCEHPNETWLPLLEKAYAKAHGDYAAIEGGFTGEGIEDLTGGVTSGLFTTDILDKEYFWKEELMKVNQQFLFGCSTGLWGRGWGDRKGIMELHAYSVMRAVEMDGERLLLLKNPWGKGEWKGPWSDGSKEWTSEWLQKLGHRFGDDGAFWISYKDLLRKYQAFDRTRLFGPEWKITSIWTTLNVPWTVEYHDTKFSFTLKRTGPVVIALSQLDDRYFRGLEGQYKFGLSFRVHKAGEEDYLVRTQSTYRMTRSVNVELELEAGEYHVLVKLDARRRSYIMPVEDVVRENAKERREKLLRIGLAYDLAHSKSKHTASPEEKTAWEAYRKHKHQKSRERMRKNIKEEKQRKHYENVLVMRKDRRRFERDKERKKAKAEKKEAERKEAEEAEKKEAEKKEAEPKEAEHQETGKMAEEPEPAVPAGSTDETAKESQDGGTKIETDAAPTESQTQPDLETSTDGGDDTPSASTSFKTASESSLNEEKLSVPEEVHKEDETSEEQKTPTAEDKVAEEKAIIEDEAPKETASTENKAEPTTVADITEAPKPTLLGAEEGKAAVDNPPAGKKESQGGGSGSKDAQAEGKVETVKPKEDPVESVSPGIRAKLQKALGMVSTFQDELKAMLGDDMGNMANLDDATGTESDGDDEAEQMGQHAGRSGERERDRNRDRVRVRERPGVPPPRMSSRQRGFHPQQPLPGRYPPPPPPGWRPPPVNIRVNTNQPYHQPHLGQFRGPPPRPQPQRGGSDSEGYVNDVESAAYETLDSAASESELSDREVDYHISEEKQRNMMDRGDRGGQRGPPGGGSFDNNNSDNDEFVRDPWNAVAVVGLRVYYKITDEEKASEAEKDTEGDIVTLKVVKPNYWDPELYSSDENDKKKQEEEKKDGENEAKVLDVDDSAKDATVGGEKRKAVVEGSGAEAKV